MNHQRCNSITKPLHDSSMSKAPQKLKAPKNLAQKVMTTPMLIVMIALLLKGMTALVLKALLKAITIAFEIDFLLVNRIIGAGLCWTICIIQLNRAYLRTANLTMTIYIIKPNRAFLRTDNLTKSSRKGFKLFPLCFIYSFSTHRGSRQAI